MTLNLLQPTPAEIQAGERVLHEALSDNGMAEPDGFYVALAESVLEAAKEARFREFRAECEQDELRAVPTLRLATYHGEIVDPLDAATGESRR